MRHEKQHISITYTSVDMPQGQINLQLNEGAREVAEALARLAGVHWGQVVTRLLADALEQAAERAVERIYATHSDRQRN